MSDIKPIETIYNGYRFRSRLEAKWAVYFDALHIEYEYEPEGYVFSNGTCYLPDFYLPQMESYFEVKPYSISEKDACEAKEKLEYLAEGTNKFAMICYGDPVDNDIQIYGHFGCDGYVTCRWIVAEFIRKIDVVDDDMFTVYRQCNVGTVVGDRYERKDFRIFKPNTRDCLNTVLPFNQVFSFDGIPYNQQEYARQARFEHGECC